MEPKNYCTHLPSEEKLLTPTVLVCSQCVAMGSDWVHLRLCQTCGEVHCCDSSPNRHATQHFMETGHPVVSSAEPGESWAWCFDHELFMPLPSN